MSVEKEAKLLILSIILITIAWNLEQFFIKMIIVIIKLIKIFIN
jgi:hypothetical protein